MPGTLAGGKAAAATNKAKHGADYYTKIGAKGGRNGRGYGFAHGKVDPVEAGRKGGHNGKPYTRKSRPSKKKTLVQHLMFWR